MPIMQLLTVLASAATNLPADLTARRSTRANDLCRHARFPRHRDHSIDLAGIFLPIYLSIDYSRVVFSRQAGEGQ
jgi:hypothetical protein